LKDLDSTKYDGDNSFAPNYYSLDKPKLYDGPLDPKDADNYQAYFDKVLMKNKDW